MIVKTLKMADKKANVDVIFLSSDEEDADDINFIKESEEKYQKEDLNLKDTVTKRLMVHLKSKYGSKLSQLQDTERQTQQGSPKTKSRTNKNYSKLLKGMTCGREEQGKMFEGYMCRDSLQRGMLQDSPIIRTQSPVFKNKTYQEFARSRTFQEPGRSRAPLECPAQTKTVHYFPMGRTARDSPVRKTPQNSSMSRTFQDSPVSETLGNSPVHSRTPQDSQVRTPQKSPTSKTLQEPPMSRTPQDFPVSRTPQDSPVRTPQESSMSKTLPESPVSETPQGSSDMMAAMNTMMKQQMQMQKLMVQMIAKNHEQDKRLKQTEKKLRSKQEQNGLTLESEKKNIRNKTEKERKIQSERNQPEHLRLYMRTQQKKSMDFKRKQDLEGKVVEQHKKTDQIAEQLKCRQEQEIKKKLKTSKHVGCVPYADAILNRCEKNEVVKEKGHGLKRKNEEKIPEFPIKIWKSGAVTWEDIESGEAQSMELIDTEKETVRHKKLLILNQECWVEHDVEEKSTEQNAVGQELKHMVESDMEQDQLERFDSCQNVQKQPLELTVVKVRIKEELKEAVDHESEITENEMEKDKLNVQEQQLELAAEEEGITERLENELIIDESKNTESETDKEKLETLEDQQSQNLEDQLVDGRRIKQEPVDHEMDHLIEREMEKKDNVEIPQDQNSQNVVAKLVEHMVDGRRIKQEPLDHEIDHLVETEMEKKDKVDKLVNEWKRIKQEQIDHELEQVVESKMEKSMKRLESLNDQAQFVQRIQQAVFNPDFLEMQKSVESEMGQDKLETDQLDKPKVQQQYKHGQTPQELLRLKVREAFRRRQQKAQKQELEQRQAEKWLQSQLQGAKKKGERQQSSRDTGEEFGRHDGMPESSDERQAEKWDKPKTTGAEVRMDKIVKNRGIELNKRKQIDGQDVPRDREFEEQAVMKKREGQQSSGETGEEFSRHDWMPESSDDDDADDMDYIIPGQFEKRRKSQEQDGDVKRMRFLERNRAAATRCRNKRKQWINNLEEKADDLNSTNSKLQNEVTTLRNEVAQLKQLLLAHKDCPVTVMQRKAQVQILPGSGAADLQAVSAVSAEEAEEVMEIVTTVAASAQPVHQHTTVITAQTLAAPQGTS